MSTCKRVKQQGYVRYDLNLKGFFKLFGAPDTVRHPAVVRVEKTHNTDMTFRYFLAGAGKNLRHQM